ncbi:MAG: GAF domain-containing protein [Rhodoferax sp.]|nr:GAF domain-containing protein [Rhodoferax sp.]
MIDSKLLRSCETEKLHLSGAIQSFGALLWLDEQLCVAHASANLAAFVGASPQQMLGQSVVDCCSWLPQTMLERLGPKAGDTLANALSVEGKSLFITLTRGERCIVLEIEYDVPLAEPMALHHSNYQRPLLTVPRDAAAMTMHHQALLDAFRNITGYDRIMLYQFREDWAGEVIAEVAAADIGSYLGLRFPASDIPAIARNLYLLNPARLIPDATAAAVPLLALENAPPPDLTYSTLRSVAAVHLQYLGNMGMRASFSVPIRITGRLWGLVACHHLLQPKWISPTQRQACIDTASAYALGVASFISSQRLQSMDSLERRTDNLLRYLANCKDPLDGIATSGDQFRDMLAADGFALAIGDQVTITGNAPDLDGMGIIDNWFLSRDTEWVASTDHLESLFPDQTMLLAAASGMLAVKARSQHSGWVRFYWFRQQEPEQVAWAGNPNKPVTENAGAVALSPRRSFERWVETKTGYSRPWSNEERMTAAKFRNTLIRWL